MSVEPEPLSLEGNGAAARERIEHINRALAYGFFNLRAEFIQQFRVVGVLPLHHALDEIEEVSFFVLLLLDGGIKIGAIARVVDDGRKENGACNGERSSRPPQMQCRRVPVPN